VKFENCLIQIEMAPNFQGI